MINAFLHRKFAANWKENNLQAALQCEYPGLIFPFGWQTKILEYSYFLIDTCVQNQEYFSFFCYLLPNTLNYIFAATLSTSVCQKRPELREIIKINALQFVRQRRYNTAKLHNTIVVFFLSFVNMKFRTMSNHKSTKYKDDDGWHSSVCSTKILERLTLKLCCPVIKVYYSTWDWDTLYIFL